MESSSRAFLFSTCPTFLIEIQGPHIRKMSTCERLSSNFAEDMVTRAWYEVGFAPELLEVQLLAGGFYVVAMEFLVHPWEPFLLLDDLEKRECRLVVLEALKKVHGLFVFGSMNVGSVHRDARESIVLLRRKEGVFAVKFIDFDWAGKDSVNSYLLRMNHL